MNRPSKSNNNSNPAYSSSSRHQNSNNNHNTKNTQQLQNQSICSICGLQPQDLLILQCKHNLCIQCAAQVYNINPKKQILKCQICLVETILDPQAIKELELELQLQIQDQDLNQNQNQAFFINKMTQSNRPPKPSMKKNTQNSIKLCSQHNQQLLYFCFDCQTFKICSQCILTIKHQNHKVCTIKKAMKNINKRIVQHSKMKEQFKNKLIMKKQTVLRNKQEFQNQIFERKNLLKLTFDDIVKSVSDKYNSLVEYLDDASQRNIEILDGSLNLLDSKIEQLSKAIEFQKSLLKEKGQRQKIQKKILIYYTGLTFENQQIQLPNELIGSHLSLYNSQQVVSSLKSLLNQLQWIDQDDPQNSSNSFGQMQGISRKHKISQDFSIINNDQNYQLDLQRNYQNINNNNKFALKQSKRSQMNYSYTGGNHNNYQNSSFNKNKNLSYGKSNSKKKNNVFQDSDDPSKSRKLELSRSISNATNIINKLQSRLKNI